MLGGEFALVFNVGAGGADVAGGAGAFAFVGEELELDADGEALLKGHALRRLRMKHDAAVEVHVVRSVGHHLAFELVFHAQDVVRIGEIAVKMAEFFIEGGVFVVAALEDAIFDAESVVGVFAEGVSGDFGSPTGEVFAVEEADPAFFGGKDGREAQSEKEGANHDS